MRIIQQIPDCDADFILASCLPSKSLWINKSSAPVAERLGIYTHVEQQNIIILNSNDLEVDCEICLLLYRFGCKLLYFITSAYCFSFLVDTNEAILQHFPN